MQIRKMHNTDWSRVQDIYQKGLDTGIASFETEVPSYEKWDTKFLQTGRLVLETEEGVVGWTALSKVSPRYAYRGVAEVTIYLHPDAQGQGWGSALMTKLIEESEEAGIWTLHSAIFPQNEASVQLHLKMGCRKIGLRQRVAYRDGHWHDNLLMEKRSTTVGLNKPTTSIPT